MARPEGSSVGCQNGPGDPKRGTALAGCDMTHAEYFRKQAALFSRLALATSDADRSLLYRSWALAFLAKADETERLQPTISNSSLIASNCTP